VPFAPAPPSWWTELELPVPPAPWDWPLAFEPACAVTVTDVPGNDVLVPVPPAPMVKLMVPETARVVSSASSPPPPPPPEWLPLRACPPLPPSPRHWVSAATTPAGVDHDPLLLNVTVVTERAPLNDKSDAWQSVDYTRLIEIPAAATWNEFVFETEIG